MEEKDSDLEWEEYFKFYDYREEQWKDFEEDYN